MKKRMTGVPVTYDPAKIEKKWQKKWAASKIYRSKESVNKNDPPHRPGGKCYVLDMFPYPSGEGLHVGHIKGYIATDVYSRMKRMQGKNVLHPMGFDAFGLPAENYAIKTKTNPADSVAKNVVRYKKQLEIGGFDYDWSREVNTTDPKFYKWTQWIFLQLWKKGLAYESNEPINWCPSCMTGLANEDLEDGRCERCGTPIEKKPMRQWVLRITDYAERLLKDLDAKHGNMPLLDWPEAIKESQRNWIGKSAGAEIDFRIAFSNKKIRVVLIHGYKGSPKDDFFPWLKSELEKRGHEVQIPALPDTLDPKEADQVEKVLSSCDLDENTIIIAHSLGCVVAMKALMKSQKPIGGMTLVAPALDPAFGPDVKPREYHKNFKWNFDFDLIKKLTSGRMEILSDLNEANRAPYLRQLSKQLSAGLVEVSAGKKHFTSSVEPAVLRSVTARLTVFTTRPDTLYGVTYVVLAPEHPWVSELTSIDVIENRAEVQAYIQKANQKTTIERSDTSKEKTGIELKGIKAINPANGEAVPIWIADYVLADYGTGAVMAVPAHDERDAEFSKVYNLPVKQIDLADKEEITRKFGRKITKYKLRDWVFSRQRYWGEPIPLIHCERCGVVAVPEKDLPVKLPKVKSYEPTGTGESPLAAISKWVNIKCPQCRGKAKRETNTMPQWAGSSWYYLRYMDPKNKQKLVDPANEKHWAPVDLYVGGAEHATRHLIYARFWHKFLYDIGVVSDIEPFKKLQSVGLIMGEDGRKMSKRFGNVVNPDEIVKIYGADTLRLYEMFMGPFDQQIAWSTASMIGSRRFIERVWKLGERVWDGEGGRGVSSTFKSDDIHRHFSTQTKGYMPAPIGTVTAAQRIIHRAIKKVTADIENLRFNTAVSTLMITLNESEKAEAAGRVGRADFEAFLKLLAPFAPHVADELWSGLGNKRSIHIATWPAYDPAMLAEQESTIMVQVNGKTRGSFKVPTGAGKDMLEKMARSLPDAQKWLGDKSVKRAIVIPDRLVNIVTQ